MPCEEVSARRELAGQLLQKFHLGPPVKIDDHVPAKDNLRQLGQTEVGVHKVDASKLDQGAHFGNDSKQVRFRVTAAHEILSPEVLGNGSDRIGLKNACGGLGQNRCAD